MPESSNRWSVPPGRVSRYPRSRTPSAARARPSSWSRCSASAGPSPSRWASRSPMTSPRSPRVQVTTVTGRPPAAQVASSAPVASDSSSGCACTATRPPEERLTQRSGALGAGRDARALRLVEHDLADAHDLGRHLDALVLAGELEGLLQREVARRDEVLEVVGGGRAHVRELLLLGDVHVHVLVARVLADDLPLVHLLRGLDEERAALLQVDHGERRDGTRPVGDERAVDARLDRTDPRLVALGDRGRDARAAGVREEPGAEADEATRGDQELHADPAGAVVRHGLHAALALREQLRDRAEVLLGDVDGHALDGLVDLAVDLARHDLRLADRELEALATHLLDEDGQGQLATALHLPRVGTLGGQDAERDVADELLVEAVLDLARRDLVALAAATGERR